MTYGTLALQGEGRAERWVLDGIASHVAIKLKHVFPGIPKAQAAPYDFPVDKRTAADLAWFLERYPMAMSGPDRFALEVLRRRYKASLEEVGAILQADYQPGDYQGLKPGMVLRPYQGQVVDVLARTGGLLCGDEVGLGKTFVGAGACLIPRALPAIIVCAPNLQAQWIKVLTQFTTLTTHAVKITRPYRLPPADVYVFRYTQLVGWADTFADMGLGLVCYDEVQELRTGIGDDPKKPVQKGVAALRLSAAARYKLGLTATPIYGYGAEIWHVMQYIRPDVLGPLDDFQQEWCSGKSATDPEALGAYLRDENAFIRRTKRDVGKEMPPINRIVQPIDYDVKTIHNVEALARKLAIVATTGSFTERGNAARELDARLRQETGIAKAPGIANFLRMIVEGGAPVVCWLWHREVYAIIMKALEDLKPAMYTGSETAGKKGESLRRFLEGETDILLMSLRSGAGVDGIQHRCSTGVFGELDWSPGIHHQCLGRLDREGQTLPVTGFFLTANEGSDPPMMDVLGLKAAEASAIVDPGLGVQASHTDVSHLQTLVQRYLNRQEQKAP